MSCGKSDTRKKLKDILSDFAIYLKMLCGMVQQNFVNFKDRLVFDFSKNKNGTSLFVGASSTGKTAALELIRRCMDDKLNSSLTTRYNQNKKSIRIL